MLVLTRKQNDKIQIGDNITITVLRMKGKSVRLGIEAPANVNVMRGELVFDLEESRSKERETSSVTSAAGTDQAAPVDQANVRRHGLEIGNVAASDWLADNPQVPSENRPLQGLASPAFELTSSPRPH